MEKVDNYKKKAKKWKEEMKKTSEFKKALEINPALKSAFTALTPGK